LHRWALLLLEQLYLLLLLLLLVELLLHVGDAKDVLDVLHRCARLSKVCRVGVRDLSLARGAR